MKQRKIRFLAFFLVLTLFLTTAPLASGEVATLEGASLFYSMRLGDNGEAVIIHNFEGAGEKLVIPSLIEGYPVEYVSLSNRLGESYPKQLTISEGAIVVGSLGYPGKPMDLHTLQLPKTVKILNGKICANDNLKTVAVPPSVALITAGYFPSYTVLQVENGSYAHRWAKVNEQPFEIIEHEPGVGDYDADGLCTSTDARLLLQYEAGKLTFTDEQMAAGDVDGDGKVTSTDARLVLQHATEKVVMETIAVPLTFSAPLLDSNAITEIRYVVIEKDIMSSGTVVEEGVVADSRVTAHNLNQQLVNAYDSTTEEQIKGRYPGKWMIVSFGTCDLWFRITTDGAILLTADRQKIVVA